MPRKRTELSPRAEKRLRDLALGGQTSESIAKTLKAEGMTEVSRATISRRIREIHEGRASRTAKAAKKSARTIQAEEEDADPPLPESPDDIPKDADPRTLDKMLEKAAKMADRAYAKSNLDGFGKMGRLMSALLEAKRKATPPKPPDPNERPDMIAARERARDAMHKLIDRVLAGQANA